MELGVIGLGRMGQIVVERTLAAGHTVVAYDRDTAAVDAVTDAGAVGVDALEAVCDRLAGAPRLWLMLPAGEAIDATLDALAPQLSAEAIVVDGGNSHHADSHRRAAAMPAAYLDCGTSGGPASAEAGFSLMVGGPAAAYATMTPILDAVATGPDGHAHVGPAGAGHYVKMVHNGIEYALMQAYGEGFELLADGEYDLDLAQVADVWSAGAVIRSWLLELIAAGFHAEGDALADVAPTVAGGTTGRWTLEAALAAEVPVPLISAAVTERYASRAKDRLAHRIGNRLRYGFGRHPVVREE